MAPSSYPMDDLPAGPAPSQSPHENQPPNPHKTDLNTPIAELYSCSGHRHPDYPHTLREYYLLTSQKLDSLVYFYHQVHPPTEQTGQYPVMIRPWIGTRDGLHLDVESKRASFGTFIGFPEYIVDPKFGNPLRYNAQLDGPVGVNAVGDGEDGGSVREKKGLFSWLGCC
ncbi:uncharacterized protein N7515_009246 [Penicillium bovifimosum]|uniref:Uncharacterized protein n=1 Tax=Penicillium bovifimosum TaxID=126998 RepID=A0A9W9GJ86_9EURO|nr:uncharacterized protein N7515_009246 [Penicillium bovifimosum]KAJ5121285.1 hypothetical protein N7515_009246 [Penicillium bovifimosum]